MTAKGAHSSRFDDLTDVRFGRLVARHYLGRRKKRDWWFCECDCGGTKEVRDDNLKTGHTTACGCHRRRKTGKTGPRPPVDPNKTVSSYYSWRGARNRCLYNTELAYKYYGGRGIKMCDRWLYGEDGITGYQCFKLDMGPKPSHEHSLDRIDVNGDYRPGNCRWATAQEQALNKRPRMLVQSNVILVALSGQQYTLTEALGDLGTTYYRYRKYLKATGTPQEAITLMALAKRRGRLR